MEDFYSTVIPAKAGIHNIAPLETGLWVSAFAGTTAVLFLIHCGAIFVFLIKFNQRSISTCV